MHRTTLQIFCFSKGGEKEKLEDKTVRVYDKTIEIVDAISDYASATGGTDKAMK